MSVIFLAHNGIGVGHLARSLALCDALTTVGEAPVIFSQGIAPRLGDHQYPGKTIPTIWKATRQERAAISLEVERYAGLSSPAIVFEDTHPSSLEIGSSIRRILVVRPTHFSYMVSLREQYQDSYQAFLVADAPGSPTWVFDEQETRRILSWPDWFILGPVYRRPTKNQRKDVMQRYGISDGDPVCVFSMGGGGVRSANDPDIPVFLGKAGEIGRELKRIEPKTRLLFVRGPLCPADIVIQDIFEVVSNEPHVPALLALARGAVIRPGFNSTWECLSGGTKFMPITGTSYQEPIAERITRLLELGHATFDLPQNWIDNEWFSKKLDRAEQIKMHWAGSPDPSILSGLLRQTDHNSAPLDGPASFGRRSERSVVETVSSRLAIRIDDVIHLDPNLRWLLKTLLRYALPASLEVIPYLCRFSEEDLDLLDPTGQFAIGQHGYAHIPRVSADGKRGEFSFASLPTALEIEEIRKGREALLRRFPNKFLGGFSAPFDGLPEWLGALWKELGGVFVSCIWARPRLPQVKIARVAIETWDWTRHGPIPVETILEQIHSACVGNARAGMVIHPWLLNFPEERARLTELFERISELGIQGISITDLLDPEEDTEHIDNHYI